MRAYFITFSTYGSRLPGDARGSIDKRANSYGEPMFPPSRGLVGSFRLAMRWPPYRMGDPERVVVANAIVAAFRKGDQSLLALNVRTNHVHLVCEPSGPPEAAMNAAKAVATGALRRASLVDAERKVWSRHGSTRYLFEELDVTSAANYVVELQGANLGGAWYSDPRFTFDGRQAGELLC